MSIDKKNLLLQLTSQSNSEGKIFRLDPYLILQKKEDPELHYWKNTKRDIIYCRFKHNSYNSKSNYHPAEILELDSFLEVRRPTH